MADILDSDQFLKEAKRSVEIESGISSEDLYIVWFAKVLGNWKALVSTDVVAGQYWEVTYNGNSGHVYVDRYEKVSNTLIHKNEL